MVSRAFVPLSFCVFLFLQLGLSSSASPNVADQCTNELAKVTSCLQYASGKSAAPTADCCTAVKDIRSKAPVCLCFIIQQVNDGTATVKDLGLKVDKLLSMPAECKLADSSASNCPKLLGLSPTSPDYALFMGSNSTTSKSTPSGSTASPATPSGSGSSTASPATTSSSSRSAIKPQLTVAVAFIVSMLPMMGLRLSI